MFRAARHVASGRHSSILAIPSEDATDAWTVLKVVSTPRAGRSIGSKPHDVYQEIQILDKLYHPNIIHMLGYKYDTNLHEYHIKLPFLPLSLPDLLAQQLHSIVVQSVIFQILLALAHIHAEGIAHRDINPNNIMIDWDGTVKLIDFGVAWTGGDDPAEEEKAWYETQEEMVCDVGTGRWRAPELLFSPTTYHASAIDLWALGVIITDMHDHLPPHPGSDYASDEEEDLRDPLDEDDSPRLVRKPLFDDRYGDIGLAGSIFRVLGTPTIETWPEFDKLPDAGKIDFIHCDPQSLDALFPDVDQRLLNLTTKLLRLSPSHRTSAKEALKHAFFESTLVPAKEGVWHGSDHRVDLSRVCVVEKEGKRLIDHLGEALDSRREFWGIPQ